MEQVKCFIPETLEEALRIRKETGATVLAGGSDLMVANSMGAGVTPAFKGDVLIITNLKELKGIRALPDGSVEIGACTTSAEIARSPIAPELLKDAASRMGRDRPAQQRDHRRQHRQRVPQGRYAPAAYPDGRGGGAHERGRRAPYARGTTTSSPPKRPRCARTRSSRRSSSPSRTSPTLSSARSVCAARTPSPS